MLEFNARDFYEVTTLMRHTLTMIEARRLKSVEEEPDGSVTYQPLTDRVFLGTMVERCDELNKSLEVLGARITIMAVQELREDLTGPHPTYEGLQAGFADIDKTLKRELKLVKLLSLNAAEQEWFDPPEPLFHPDYLWMYPSMAFDLDEAAKCVALGRPTAAVFHLMRTLEIGIGALARCLQIPDPTKPAERNWGVVLREIKAAIDRKWPTAADRVSGDGALFESLFASLDAVKNPWRNATMHVENKYTDDEARHIFAAMKGFFAKLIDRMDEAGNPKA